MVSSREITNIKMNFSFTYKETKYKRARIGKIVTPHGEVNTPAFIFCATKASIKGVATPMMKDEDTQIILSNTYHLMLQPGSKIVQKAGGLHKFMNWDGPMLTDSGGFQVFSLGHGSISSEIKGKRNSHRPKTLLKITEEGALFKSYIDGSNHLLTPEKSIQVQHELGADLILMFDECTPYNVNKRYTADSMRLSHRWGQRSIQEFDRLGAAQSQRLYGIIQGGVYNDLRDESCDFVNTHDFFGHAIGGSLGAEKEQMYDVVEYTSEKLRRDRPIHLLGIGGIKDVFEGVQNGIDTFDCVHPTRMARHGGALVKTINNPKPDRDHINLNNAENRESQDPIEKDCHCHTCKNYTRSYLHHLLKAKELLAFTLISIHNIHFMNKLMDNIRHSLANDSFEELKKQYY
jgi:queuine tRNA-ribosyltransferase